MIQPPVDHRALYALYTSELVPFLSEIQEAWASAKRRAVSLFLILFAVLTVLICVLTREISHLPACALLVLVPSVIVALVYYLIARGTHTKRYKDFVIQKVLDIVAPGMTYEREWHISLEQFKKSGIYTASVDSYKGEDCFSGKYQGVDLIFSELHAQEKHTSRDSKGNTQTHYHTIFKGVFFVADFNKDFRTSTLVIPTAAERVFGGTVGRWVKKLDFAHSGALTRMENPEFEKMFAVYAQDAIEARYILTPNIMERMMAIQRRFPGNVAFAFHESEIYIAIPLNTDFFEPPPNLDFSCVTLLYGQLELFFNLVDELNLTLRIWTKT